MAEYVLILASLSVVAILGLATLGTQVLTLFTTAALVLTTVILGAEVRDLSSAAAGIPGSVVTTVTASPDSVPTTVPDAPTLSRP